MLAIDVADIAHLKRYNIKMYMHHIYNMVYILFKNVVGTQEEFRIVKDIVSFLINTSLQLQSM